MVKKLVYGLLLNSLIAISAFGATFEFKSSLVNFSLDSKTVGNFIAKYQFPFTIGSIGLFYLYHRWCNTQAQARENLANFVDIELSKYQIFGTNYNPQKMAELAKQCSYFPGIPNFGLLRLIKKFYAALNNQKVFNRDATMETPQQIAHKIKMGLYGGFMLI